MAQRPSGSSMAQWLAMETLRKAGNVVSNVTLVVDDFKLVSAKERAPEDVRVRVTRADLESIVDWGTDSARRDLIPRLLDVIYAQVNPHAVGM